MSFSGDLRNFTVKVETRNRDIFTGCVDHALDAIQNGDAVTGAPGQPVGQYGPGYHPGKVGGHLRASWQKFYESPTVANVATNAEYAPQEEDGISYAHGGDPIQQRSTVGGFHSRKLVIANWDRVVEHVTKEVIGGDR